MRAFVVLVALAACGKTAPPPSTSTSTSSDPWAAPTPRAPDVDACETLPFAKTLPVAEASGAAFVDLDGARAMIVVGDSGNHGEYILIDPATGDVREKGHLPLPDGISDDLEGITSPDARTIVGLVSDGTLLTWTRAAHASFTLATSSRIGDARDKNYEGICLTSAHVDAAACAGFAASKADGKLWCLRATDGGLAIDTARSIAITRPQVLADCGFTPDGATLLVGANVFGGNAVWRVDGWTDPAAATRHELGSLGPGNAEVVVAAPEGVVYRFSDLNGTPSLSGKFRCPGAAR